METLAKRRGVIKSTLTRLENYANNLTTNNATAEDISVRLERLEELATEFNEIQCQVEDNIEEDESFREEEHERAKFEDKYFAIKSCLRRLLGTLKTSAHVQDSVRSPPPPILFRESNEPDKLLEALSQNQSTLTALVSKLSEQRQDIVHNQSRTDEDTKPSSQIKLPRITIPPFSGNYKDWMSFKDLYISLVHENKCLSLVEKFQFLKTSLHGEASSQLKHFQVTEANYMEAWEHLLSRYDKKRYIVDAHLKSIMSQPGITLASPTEFKALYNNTVESVRALCALGLPVEQWDCWLIFVIISKLDFESRQLWARQTSEEDLPSYKELTKFLEKRLTELESTHSLKQGYSKPSVRTVQQYKARQSYVSTTNCNNCPSCSGNHMLFKCATFRNLTVPQRKALVMEKSLCFNCLSPTHSVTSCQRSSCRICGRKHNSLLHVAEQRESQTNNFRVSVNSAQACAETVLPTAVVLANDAYGNSQHCRLLLDSGSMITMISESCMQRLALRRQHARILVNGIGETDAQVSKGKVTLTLTSRINSETIQVSAVILKTLTDRIPPRNIKSYLSDDMKQLALADPDFNLSGHVDILLGSDILFEVLRDGKLISPAGGPVAQNTIFGWVIAGRCVNQESNSEAMCCHLSSIDIDHYLRNFWEVEELPHEISPLTEEEQQCMDHFATTFRRREDGQYEVQLPFKKNSRKLGDSKQSALRRFLSIERRLSRDHELREQYTKFMKEYLDLSHMSRITESEKYLPTEISYYLPHHPVMKADSVTSKLRVVYDASSPTTTGVSLNDNLMNEPVVQSDLISILMRFRKHRYAFAADIAKMYRQILVNNKHMQYQRILWRPNSSEPIVEYKLLTVTYGTAAAPFLATRTLNQLANDESVVFPAACKVLKEDFYVDDCISGSDNLQLAISIARDLIELLNRGNFELRKWKSNSTELLQSLSSDQRDPPQSFQFISNEATKTLGLQWHPTEDFFSYKIELLDTQPATKRKILSVISKIYDPLGWLSPCIIRAKIIMQKLWLIGGGWDDPIPESLASQWTSLFSDLKFLEIIHIPRWLGYCSDVQLHGFTDASEVAYGAVVYLRSRDEHNEVVVNIVASKSKVAPIKQLSLPRLELCGAHLLVKLLKKVKQAMKLTDAECYGYSDSTIVLSWLADHPRRWKTFVANRTSQILNELPSSNWRHVPSSENPADYVSRGTSPQFLNSCKLWWHGPDFLRLREMPVSSINSLATTGQVPEARSTMCYIASTPSQDSLLQRYSNLNTLLRVVSYCRRFIRNLKHHKVNKTTGFLTTKELDEAHDACIKWVQAETFIEEMQVCNTGGCLPQRSALKKLNPFLDDDCILRVGGRLTEADINFAQKHPIILPKHHTFTNLLVTTLHLTYMHAGPRLLLSVISQRYWIIGVRHVVRRIVYKCIQCARQRAQTATQQMSSLPRPRVRPSRPFSNSGVDYAGPILLRTWKGRGAKTIKGYICLFVCLATKALHLEAVSDLSTDAFLAAFKRFVSRRGYCANIWSDNGTNFVGAARELRTVADLIRSSDHQERVLKEFTSRGINWSFIPPSAPHFGGLWEAGIKSVKFHLKRAIGNAMLTFEEFTTLLCQIEACLNSRPLSVAPTQTDQASILTPNHFLIGGPVMTVPEVALDDININRLSRWQYTQSLQQSFWKQWSKDYLATLQTRSKWQDKAHNIQPNMVVIIKDNNLPPSKWLMGRILDVHPGPDNLVRVASVLTQNGTIKRPISKLCPLPLEEIESC